MKQCKTFPQYYADGHGAIWKVFRGKRGFDKVKLRVNYKGYLSFSGWHEKKRRTFFAHVLIMDAWCEPRPSPTHQVCHSDGNPSNNSLENLRWGTPKENAMDRSRHGTGRGQINYRIRKEQRLASMNLTLDEK